MTKWQLQLDFFLCAIPVDSYFYQLLLKALIIYKWITITQQRRYQIQLMTKKEKCLLLHWLKHWNTKKSKCGKDEVFKLVKDMIKENITRDIFNKALESLTESGSVKCSFISNITCLSLRKQCKWKFKSARKFQQF